MRRQRRQINSVSSCHKHENDPEESFQGSGRNIIVIMPLVNILRIHPPLLLLFCVWKCSHESFEYASGWSCHFHCSSLSFLWMRTESNSSLSERNYGNFLEICWEFCNSSSSSLLFPQKRSKSLWRKDFHINTRVCSCIWTIFIVLTARLNNVLYVFKESYNIYHL